MVIIHFMFWVVVEVYVYIDFNSFFGIYCSVTGVTKAVVCAIQPV